MPWYLSSCAVKKFWRMTDYGFSVKPLIKRFFGCAGAFAVIYWLSAVVGFPLVANMLAPDAVTIRSLVSSVSAETAFEVPAILYAWLVLLLRAFYFSIVTMTTLGFGDMYANPDVPWLSYPLLMVQVILGYVMLGALVTYMGILFTSPGPARSFSEPDEDEPNEKPEAPQPPEQESLDATE